MRAAAVVAVRAQNGNARPFEALPVELVEHLDEQAPLPRLVAPVAHLGQGFVVGASHPAVAGHDATTGTGELRHPRRVAAVDAQLVAHGARAGAAGRQHLVDRECGRVVDALVGEVAEEAVGAGVEAAGEAQVEHVEVALAQHVLGLVEDDLVVDLAAASSVAGGPLDELEQLLAGKLGQLLLPEALAADLLGGGRHAGQQPQVLVKGARDHAGALAGRAGAGPGAQVLGLFLQPAAQRPIEAEKEHAPAGSAPAPGRLDGEQRLARAGRPVEHDARVALHGVESLELLLGIVAQLLVHAPGARLRALEELELRPQERARSRRTAPRSARRPADGTMPPRARPDGCARARARAARAPSTAGPPARAGR